MLIPNFYTILSTQQENNNTISFNIILNKDAEVYKGHFPQEAIAPGVCTMQMIKECLAQLVGCQSLVLTHIKQCRFLKLLRPSDHPLKVVITLQEDNHFTAQITDGNDICLKLKAHYKTK